MAIRKLYKPTLPSPPREWEGEYAARLIQTLQQILDEWSLVINLAIDAVNDHESRISELEEQ